MRAGKGVSLLIGLSALLIATSGAPSLWAGSDVAYTTSEEGQAAQLQALEASASGNGFAPIPIAQAPLSTGVASRTSGPQGRYLQFAQSESALIPAASRTLPRTVPLKNSRNALMVEATLTNAATGRRATGVFIIDTGATYTSISRELAEQLGLNLHTGESVHITTANGRINVPKVTVDQIQVNDVHATDVQATVIDVHPGSSFSGLLGLSFIRQFKMTIDPVGNQLVFEAP